MTDCVIDSSTALAWALPDETSEEAERVLSRMGPRDAIWVPALWWYEIANGLLVAQRRERLTEAARIRLTDLYQKLPVRTDVVFDGDMVRRLHTLAIEHHLSAYDAAYLELAQRRDLGIVTMDRQLRSAAQEAGVRILR
jgi:predicted nucleic acid-binding protein